MSIDQRRRLAPTPSPPSSPAINISGGHGRRRHRMINDSRSPLRRRRRPRQPPPPPPPPLSWSGGGPLLSPSTICIDRCRPAAAAAAFARPLTAATTAFRLAEAAAACRLAEAAAACRLSEATAACRLAKAAAACSLAEAAAASLCLAAAAAVAVRQKRMRPLACTVIIIGVMEAAEPGFGALLDSLVRCTSSYFKFDI
jgi:hypothetical protein